LGLAASLGGGAAACFGRDAPPPDGPAVFFARVGRDMGRGAAAPEAAAGSGAGASGECRASGAAFSSAITSSPASVGAGGEALAVAGFSTDSFDEADSGASDSQLAAPAASTSITLYAANVRFVIAAS